MVKRGFVSEEDRALFRDAVGTVRPVADERHYPPRQRKRRHATEPDPAPGSVPRDFEPMVPDAFQSGDVLSFVRPGLQHRQLRRLRRGQMPVDAQIDLHGMSVTQANAALSEFLGRARERGWRCLRIIHGKGYGSRRGGGIIKSRVDRWLRARPQVVAFCSARPADGGTGAVYVLLRR